MKKNLKYILVILVVIILPALIVFIASIGSYFGNFGPFQYIFTSDNNAVWNPTAAYTGSLGRPTWPETSLFIPTMYQAIISLILLVLAFIITRGDSKNQNLRVYCMLLAIVTCIRHLLWRGLYTIDTDNIANAIVGFLVYFAEISAFIAMILGYFQMYKPVPSPYYDITKIPKDKLPNVDVFITTYNEGTDILYKSIVGALNIDYPKKTVYILDDGNRQELKELCNHLGCQYITRPTNEHAKAGNLNNALKYTNGDLIAILDADHVPKVNFLKETVGFFLNEAKTAYVQTPQHFFTPDPFQRNLLIERSVTNEQDLFYHVIQPGNNYWGAAFFAGSGAVFRRQHLQSIGGFAIETITEDTHTGIRLHAKGYKSFYVNKNLAAGLAQDSFVDYLNQRLRWGRGMFQILRFDNPLFVSGLKIGQRLCYFSGIYYFFHGLPRIIFLLAPLCFLAGGLKPIDAGIFEMLIYYIPSFFVTIVTFSFITNGIRQTFWSEVYESATALYLAITTSLSILSPRRARFKVTPKGTITSEINFEWSTVMPQLIIASATMIGLILGLVRILITPDYLGGILPNIFWASYNMVLMIGAIIVASNRPQYRSSPRIFRKVRCELSLIDGTYAVGTTTNISETGLAVEVESPVPVSDIVTINITDSEIGLNTTITGQVIRSELSRENHHYLGFKLVNRTDQQHQGLVRHMFTSPSMWQHDFVYDKKPSQSFAKLFTTIFRWGVSEEVALCRVAPRFGRSLNSVIIAKNQTIMGTTAEISESGAAVKVQGSFNINYNDDALLRIQWQDNSTLELQAQVMRIINNGKGELIIGFRFVSMSLEQKLSIIKYLYEKGDDLVRVTPMFKKNLPCILLKQGSPKPISCYSTEISETSIVVTSNEAPLSNGENVKLILQWEDQSRLEIISKVTTIYQDRSAYLIKLNYTNFTPEIRKDLIKRLYSNTEEAPLKLN